MLLRNTFLLFISLFLAFVSSAQIPDGINYQAVLRDSDGAVLSNKTVNMRFTILRSITSNTIYREIQSATTNEFGIVNTVIGSGNAITGSFDEIIWENAGMKLRVEIDPQGGNFFEQFGESDFQSVPFALAAETANSLSTVARITSSQILASGAQDGQILRWNGNAWVASNESTAAITTSTRISGNGTPGSPLDLASQGATTGQVLKWNGSSWAPAEDVGGGGSPLNAGNGIEINNNTISAKSNDGIWNASQIRGRNVTQTAPAPGQVLSYDGNSWTPTTVNSDLQLPFDGSGGDGTTPAFRATNNVGIGVNGRGTIGVRATGVGTPPGAMALELQNGGIRVTGSNRPALRVGGVDVIPINSPLSDGNPNALVFATQLNPDPITNPGASPFNITYDFTDQRWVIISHPEITYSYNVFIINQ